MAKAFNIKEWQDKYISEQCGDVKHYDSPEGEGKMAKGDAVELSKDAADVANMIGPHTNLPEWVESKITLAANYLNTVKDFLSNYDVRQGVNEQFDDSWDYSTDQKGMEDSSGVYNDTEGPTFQADYLSDVEPKIGGSQRAALEELVNMYSFAEILDTIEDIYAKNNELAAADYAGEFASKFRKWMDRD